MPHIRLKRDAAFYRRHWLNKQIVHKAIQDYEEELELDLEETLKQEAEAAFYDEKFLQSLYEDDDLIEELEHIRAISNDNHYHQE